MVIYVRLRELMIAGLTVSADADVAPCVIHARSFPPLFGNRIETTHGIEMFVTIEATDHVDDVVQCTQPMISSRCCVGVYGEEPSVSSET